VLLLLLTDGREGARDGGTETGAEKQRSETGTERQRRERDTRHRGDVQRDRDREAAGKGGIRVDSGSNALSLCVDFWRSFYVLSKFSLAVDL
jgi:hypothetical protein